MRVIRLFEVLVVNAILIALLLWVTGDYGFRASYWASEKFSSATTRYPLFLITSAAKGSTAIPGLLTVDWQQVVLLVLVVADLIYVRGLFLNSQRRPDGGPPRAE